ncbi:translocon-associated protein [Musa troglodytarum]|uniref:Translocon-associated protein n=1 Tax=Musa troglodytarum TaxID=320322 RepID=A0A9E7L6M3_9LILI|nr:translocon-associated protein [Musa troglodytarum]
MAKPRSGSLLVALLTALVLATSPAAMANSDAPFMVAHKKVSLTRLKSGVERVSVSIDLYNQGSSTAYDVSLNDDNWSQDMFDLVSDGTSKTWERLDAGSSASHSFILESKAKGMFHGSPAVIKFRIPTKAAPQEAYSTPILPLDVLADKPPEKKFEWVSYPHTTIHPLHTGKEAVSEVWISGVGSDTGRTVHLCDCNSIGDEQEEAVNCSIWWMFA